MKHITEFSKKVYDVVKKIPRGKVLSYKEVAMLIGSPDSYRAVGSALKKNFNKDIPCHRVIKSNRNVGNYNRGVGRKLELLKKEGAI